MRTTVIALTVGLGLASCASAKENETQAKPAREVVPGGARIRGGGVRMDVEIGRTFTQRPIHGGEEGRGISARSAAPVVR